MNPGFKYPIDENVLRNKLLQSTSSNVEQAWEKFEHYFHQQKPICTESTKTKLSLMIPANLLFRIFLAGLIILPSLIFYRQFNAKIPAAIDKAVAARRGSTSEPKEGKVSLPLFAVQEPRLNDETNAATKTIEPQLSAVSVEIKTKVSTKAIKSLKPAIQSDSCDYKLKIPSTAPDQTPKSISLPQNDITAPQIEQTGELNEQL